MASKKDKFDMDPSFERKRDFKLQKKQNQSQMRSAQRKKNSKIFPEDEFNVDELPSGAFDKLNNQDKKPVLTSSIEDNTASKEVLNNSSKADQINQFEEDQDEYEKFDDSYFEPVVYVKK
jgi:hypothetical protein